MNFLNRLTDYGAVLVITPVNRKYVTGFSSSAGYVAVLSDQTFFITDFRYYESALKAQENGVIPADIIIMLQEKKVYSQLAELFSNTKRIYIEENFLTLCEFERLKIEFTGFELVFGASAAIESLRAVKSKAEVEKIQKAQDITDEAFSYIVNFISNNLGLPQLTEAKVALELEYFMRSHGASGIAFDTIAVSGFKSSMPHGTPSDVPLSKGFLTMDFGASYDGYCSDMTRTICIGKPDDKMRDVYETVLEAQNTALEFISAGKSGRDIDKSARDYIAMRGYDGRFGHSLGHSLGLEIHESPNFSPSNLDIIPAGAVISVEPGIYIEGKFGVRIEDIVNITETGCKSLTKSTKELIIL